ncbi:MAG: SufE family protein [Caldilinea sp. CFX5]|nr:SufE family protein [Caldilinea sp. CFX5]
MSETTIEEKIARCPAPLQTIIDEFRDALPRERLELLLEYADSLPDLPARLYEKRDNMEQIHECQSPVFLHTEIEQGKVYFYLDIPREAPTVRGYASILVEGINGTTPAAIQAMPEDVYILLGLHEAITPQRLRGLHALAVYMKRQVQRLQ